MLPFCMKGASNVGFLHWQGLLAGKRGALARDWRTAIQQRRCREGEFFIDNLLVRIHLIIVMMRWTGLAPWEFEFPFPGSLTPLCLCLALSLSRAVRDWRTAIQQRR